MGKNKKAENGANMDGETWFGMKLEEFDKDVLELAYGQIAGLTKGYMMPCVRKDSPKAMHNTT